MDFATLASSVVLLVFGAAIGFVPSYITDRRRERHALATRWDEPLFNLCREFTSAARTMQHHAGRRRLAVDPEAVDAKLDDEHARLRSLSGQLRLIGSQELQRAARMVVRHGYAVRAVAEGESDPRPSDKSPEDRYLDELTKFYVEARRLLGVPNPEAIAMVD